MGRPIRWFLSIVGLLLVVAAGLVAWAWFAAQQVDPFYEQALAVDRTYQSQCNHEMLRQTTALANEVRRPGDWQAHFTADQINGWLAVDLIENHPDILPREFSEPRVSIDKDLITVGCRYTANSISSVVFLEIEARLHESNVLGVRLRRARAGAVPLPLSSIVKAMIEGAHQSGLRLEERQVDGDPLLLITIPPPRDAKNNTLRIESLQLRPEGIFVAGETVRGAAKRPG